VRDSGQLRGHLKPRGGSGTALADRFADACGEGTEFLPPGFYERKVGKHIVYCKKDASIGTRLKSERCYDDQQMRDYLIAL
jgi:hypothetical protein